VNVDSIFNLIYRSHSIQINYVLMYVHWRAALYLFYTIT
jgi:hypothetical protein